MTVVRPFVLLVTVLLGASGVADRAHASPHVSTIASAPVTVYGAKWCSACRALERGLAGRKIVFDVVDVDDNPSAYSRAKSEAGGSNAIPLTRIARDNDVAWVVGADLEAVERALGTR